MALCANCSPMNLAERFGCLATRAPPANSPGRRRFGGITIELPPEYGKTNTDFKAADGATNECTIPLPDELIQGHGKAQG